jgi:hypothetical protein
MRGKGEGAIASVLGTADHDRVRDRILRAQFWLPATASSADVISLDAFRARRAHAR